MKMPLPRTATTATLQRRMVTDFHADIKCTRLQSTKNMPKNTSSPMPKSPFPPHFYRIFPTYLKKISL